MTDTKISRHSPISFPAEVVETRFQDGFEVVRAYAGQTDGPLLVDLSHCPKWDLQAGNLDDWNPWGRPVPAQPNGCLISEGVSINRLNRTRAAIWFLGGGSPVEPSEPNYTDLTDGQGLLAILGRQTPAIMEKLTPLDLADPKKRAPYLVQGPLLHVPCQLVVLDTSDRPAVLVSFSRGYGQAMAGAVLEAGGEFGLRPGGEKAFTENLMSLGFL